MLLIVLALFGCCFSQVLFPQRVLDKGNQSWSYQGTMAGYQLNGTIWISPSQNPKSLRTWQTMALGSDLLLLGLVDQSSDSEGHYYQGTLPGEVGCNGVGCGYFDEILGCSTWTKEKNSGMSGYSLTQTCSIDRVCGPGEGVTGTMKNKLYFDEEDNLFFHNASVVFAGTTAFLGWKLQPIPFQTPPANPCF